MSYTNYSHAKPSGTVDVFHKTEARAKWPPCVKLAVQWILNCSELRRFHSECKSYWNRSSSPDEGESVCWSKSNLRLPISFRPYISSIDSCQIEWYDGDRALVLCEIWRSHGHENGDGCSWDGALCSRGITLMTELAALSRRAICTRRHGVTSWVLLLSSGPKMNDGCFILVIVSSTHRCFYRLLLPPCSCFNSERTTHSYSLFKIMFHMSFLYLIPSSRVLLRS
jgi:hypothetical protein